MRERWSRIWNAGILLWWYRLWIRRNEFHRSLDSDQKAIIVMSYEEQQRYWSDLDRRRGIAHKRAMERHPIGGE